jgi:hypothetical protein
MSTLTIHLTEEQQKQIKDVFGKDVTELNLSAVAQGELSESQLGEVTGGGGSSPSPYIEVLSFSWGQANLGTAGTGGGASAK